MIYIVTLLPFSFICTLCKMHEVELLQMKVESNAHFIFQHQSECLLHASPWLEAGMRVRYKVVSSEIWLYPVWMSLPPCNIMSVILRCAFGCFLIVVGGNRNAFESILGRWLATPLVFDLTGLCFWIGWKAR